MSTRSRHTIDIHRHPRSGVPSGVSPRRAHRQVPARNRALGGHDLYRSATPVARSPISLAPLGWFDAADETGGSIPNRGTATGSATLGTGGNAPTALAHTGTPYLWLDGTAGNELTCTAPTGTTDYEALALDGTVSIGVAAPGAFAFATAGSWRRVQLLDTAGAVIAEYEAGLSGVSGHTDRVDPTVTWSVTRQPASTGYRSAVVRRSVLLADGTDATGTTDTLDLPAAAIPDHGVGDDVTIITVCRPWDGANASNVHATSIGTGATTDVHRVTMGSGGGGQWAQRIHDGTSGSTLTIAAGSGVDGALTAVTSRITARTSRSLRATRAGGVTVEDTAADIGALGAITSTAGRALARIDSARQGWDGEWVAVLTFARALTDTEVAQVEAWYGVA